jgi:RND family efflux transporter MFP subunit
MRSRKLWFDFLTLTILVGLITSCFWAALAAPRGAKVDEASTSSKDMDADVPSVSVLAITSDVVSGRILRRGVVAPSAQVEVVSESTARILTRHVQVGDTVEKDAPLLDLDGSITKIQLDAATAQVASAKALLAEADAELEAAKELEDEELENQTKARRDASEASLRLAESRLAEAELSHERRTIKAPISGTVSQCYLEAGEFAATSRPVAEIVATDPVRVIVKLTSQELDEVTQAETTWQIAVPGDSGDEPRSATVCYTSPMADPMTKRFDMVLEVDNDAGAFPIGARVNAICDWETSDPELTIPRKALVRRDDSLLCLRIERTDEIDVCREVSVRIASIPGLPDVVRVLDGLSEDDRIVVGRSLNLHDGLEVLVQN